MTTTIEHALHLPKGALIETLLRLPVRSLVRFKTVSRQFYQLISDPWFILSYKHRIHANPLCFTVQSHSSSHLCILMSITGEVDKLNMVPYNFELDMERMWLASSNEGLLCYIKNDTTEFVVGDPWSNSWTTVDLGIQIINPVLIAVFFQASTREHKMLWQSDGPNHTYRYDVFIVGRNTWEQIGNSPYKPYPHSVVSLNPPLLHGRLHWVGPKQQNGHLSTKWTTINTFHIDTLEFSQISHPKCITQDQLKKCVMLDIQQKLCICQFNEDKKKVKYWVLEDYEKIIWRRKLAYMEEVKGMERNLHPLFCLSSCAVFVQSQKVSLINSCLKPEVPVFYYWDFKEFAPKEMRGEPEVLFLQRNTSNLHATNSYIIDRFCHAIG